MTSITARPAELTGRLIRPGDTDYPAESAGYNLLFTHDPAVIVFARDAGHGQRAGLGAAEQCHGSCA